LDLEKILSSFNGSFTPLWNHSNVNGVAPAALSDKIIVLPKFVVNKLKG
jgi:hypothetical protein